MVKTDRNSKPSWGDILLDASLTPTQRIVLLYLAWRQGSNGHSWPKQETIAQEAGLSRRVTQEALRTLGQRGYVRTSYPEGPGRGHACHYTLMKPGKGAPDAPFDNQKGAQNAPFDNQKGAQNAPFDNQKGAQNAPEKAHFSARTIRKNRDKEQRQVVCAVSYAPTFERFWAEYPRKTGKLEAFREWEAIDPDETLVEKIIVSVRAWKRSEQWTKDGGKFIVYPVRFLKHRRFEDELPCASEPRPGDPDWLPDEDDPRVEAAIAKIGGRP